MIRILNLLASRSQSRFFSSKLFVNSQRILVTKANVSILNFASRSNKWLEFERTLRVSQIQILGMIWIEEILIQQVCYITHPCLLLCPDNSEHCFRTNCNVEFCWVENPKWKWHGTQRRGCDLREKAIRARWECDLTRRGSFGTFITTSTQSVGKRQLLGDFVSAFNVVTILAQDNFGQEQASLDNLDSSKGSRFKMD